MKKKLCLVLAVLALFLGVTEANTVKVRAAAAIGVLPENQVLDGTVGPLLLVSTTTGVITTPPRFGFVAEAFGPDGTRITGTWILDELKYTIYIDEAFALKLDGSPINGEQFGAFNDLQGVFPDIRGRNTSSDPDSVQSVPSLTPTHNVTLTNTHSVVVSNHLVATDGTSRRPFIQLGKPYSIKISIKGSFNGVSFGTKTATAMVVVGVASLWAEPSTDLKAWKDGTPWVLNYGRSGAIDFQKTLRTSVPGVGEQIIIDSLQSSADLNSWSPWSDISISEVPGALTLKAILGAPEVSRWFFRAKVRRMVVVPPSS